jgi:hypothetical protein
LQSVASGAIDRLASNFNELKLAPFGQATKSVLTGITQSIFDAVKAGSGSAAKAAVGGGIAVPPSTSSQIPGVLEAIAQGQSGGGKTGLGAIFGNLGNLFKGFGFGLERGSAVGGLAAAAPLLGLTLGAGLGGTSTLGQIAGGIGGTLVGIGLTAAPKAAGFLAPLFSNPITAIVGAGLLVGGIFLGKAAQRRKDEEASGQMLTQALQAIEQLKAGIASDQIDGSQARAIFDNQILGAFISQINTLKTKSVRESRLKNQVRDLRNVFDALIPPEIEAQQRRRAVEAERSAIAGKLIPEFATGGLVPGIDFGRDSVVSLLRPGEMVLTKAQQSAIAAMAGAGVFRAAGVPGVQREPIFANGGIAPLAAQPQTIILDVSVGISDSQAEEIVTAGVRGGRGRNVVVRTVRHARRFGEL